MYSHVPILGIRVKTFIMTRLKVVAVDSNKGYSAAYFGETQDVVELKLL